MPCRSSRGVHLPGRGARAIGRVLSDFQCNGRRGTWAGDGYKARMKGHMGRSKTLTRSQMRGPPDCTLAEGSQTRSLQHSSILERREGVHGSHHACRVYMCLYSGGRRGPGASCRLVPAGTACLCRGRLAAFHTLVAAPKANRPGCPAGAAAAWYQPSPAAAADATSARSATAAAIARAMLLLNRIEECQGASSGEGAGGDGMAASAASPRLAAR